MVSLTCLATQIPEDQLWIWNFNTTNIQSHSRNNSIRWEAFHIWVDRLQLLQQSLQIKR